MIILHIIHAMSKSRRKRKQCFFVAPLGSEGSATRKNTNRVYQKIIHHAISPLGYETERIDTAYCLGNVSQEIIRRILNADVVVADLTGLNPNVMYEVGLAHAWNRPLILLAKAGTRVPFDVQTTNVVFYRPDSEDDAVRLVRARVDQLEGKGTSFSPFTAGLNAVSSAMVRDVQEAVIGRLLKTVTYSLQNILAELVSEFEITRSETMTAYAQMLQHVTTRLENVLLIMRIQSEIGMPLPDSRFSDLFEAVHKTKAEVLELSRIFSEKPKSRRVSTAREKLAGIIDSLEALLIKFAPDVSRIGAS